MSPPTAVFSSWHGRHSDSPRAISDELLRRGGGLRQVWIVPDALDTLPSGVERAAPHSDEARDELERATWIVSNDVLALEFAKRAGATYLQTWHGTPLKRIAFDVVAPRFPGSEHHYGVELGRDVRRWDVLLSPNAYSSEILPRAFRYGGDVLETGYPRNDALLAPDREVTRARVREALGIPERTLAVLYAPTWRDDAAQYRLELDAAAIDAAFADDVVVLVRAHGLVAAIARIDATRGVRDVTAWPEISDLYLAADVLLTDYSSAMFDFAVTGKPQLFYTYDKPHYRDVLRGFYFDFDAHAPGPQLENTRDVIAALADLDAVVARHAEAYAAFAGRFCHHDDGRASARVVDTVFGGHEEPNDGLGALSAV